MILDKTKLLMPNTDVILQNCLFDTDVVDYDVVWFKDNLWKKINGTLEDHKSVDFNWGIAYHVNEDDHIGRVIYEGQLKGCDIIDSNGNWYADEHGKLTQTASEFYVGYSEKEKELTLSLYSYS